MKIIKRCPECGRWPRLQVWHVAISGGMVYQLYLKCEDGHHICMTSPSEDLEKVRVDWNRLVTNLECKMKGVNLMNWFKALGYMQIGLGFFSRLFKALDDGILTGQELLSNAIKTFNDALDSTIANDQNIMVDEDENWIMLKVRKDLLNDVKVDLTK